MFALTFTVSAAPHKAEPEKRGANSKPQDYIYSMIETLLPKAMVDAKSKQLRMLEL